MYIGGNSVGTRWTASQSFVLPSTGPSQLSFYFLKEAPNPSDDVEVTIDATKILDLDARAQASEVWELVTLDVSAFADGASHTLAFTGIAVGRYFIDDACLLGPPCDVSIDFEGPSLPEFFGEAFAASNQYAASGLQLSGQGALLNGANFGVTGLVGPNILACSRSGFLAIGGTADPPERITFRSSVEEVNVRMATGDAPVPVGATISLRAYNEADVEIDSDVKTVSTNAMQCFTVTADAIKYVVMDTTASTLAIDDICIFGDPLALSKCADDAILSQSPQSSLGGETAPPVSAEAANRKVLERFPANSTPVDTVRWWGTWVNPEFATPVRPRRAGL